MVWFPAVRAIVWTSEAYARSLRERFGSATSVVSSAHDLLNIRDTNAVAFMDGTTLAELARSAIALGVPVDQLVPPTPVIAICDEQLRTSIGWLAAYPWLSHVMNADMLGHPLATEHLRNVMTTLTGNTRPRLLDWLGDTMDGRRVRLVNASKRATRLERMSDYLGGKGVGGRTIQQLRDVAEELLTNAFYDAPVAAGVIEQPISRTQDVLLSDDGACDMVYGSRDDLAVVRVRDPFGALSRARLVEVLTRCARTDMAVEVDETMGGAGLGLWRIFSVASFVAISVIHGRSTEFLVGISKRAAGLRPYAFHLFFREYGRPVRRWKLLDAESTKPSVNNSVSIVSK